MSVQRVVTLHLWTAGDSRVGIAGETAEITAPGWLVSSDQYEADGFKVVLEEFRVKARSAFEVLWPKEEVFAKYDFELHEENEASEEIED